jgi:hypothetical protein
VSLSSWYVAGRLLTKAYGGKAIILFNEAKHFYTVTVPTLKIEKLYQPSVTGIIGMKDKSNALVSWATEMMATRMKTLLATGETWDKDTLSAVVDVAQDTWRQKRDEAASIGSIAHRVLEQMLLGKEVKLPLRRDDMLAPNVTQDMIDMANNAIDAGMRYISEHKISVIEAEAARWSPRWGYIGTGDLIAKIDGKRSALDWKTSKRLYSTVFLQLAAYQEAWLEEHPDQPLEQRVAVNIGRDGELTTEVQDNSTYSRDLKVFLGLLELWHWDRENQGKWSKPALRRLTLDEALAIAA